MAPVDMVIHTFGLKRAKEALHHRVIIAVIFATHAHLYRKLSQHGLIGLAGLLTPPI